MKKILPLIVVALGLPAASLYAGAGDGAKVIYERECTRCHGAEGKGDTRMGQRMGAKDYSDPKVQAAITDEAMFKAIKEGFVDKEGRTMMKPTEGVTDEQIKEVVKYMRSFVKK